MHGLLLASLLIWPLPAQGPDEGAELRDVFVSQRQKKKAPATTQPGHQPGAASSKESKALGEPDPAIGLGYTLYQREAGNRAVRVNASQVFRAGDALRLLIESNSDGYLYIFNAGNGRAPKMIFPDTRLKKGANRIAAHVPQEVPSSKEPDPLDRWFVFDEQAGTESLYLVVTRKPLTGVPIEKELVAYCGFNANGCPWQPSTAAWNLIAAASNVPPRLSVSQETRQEISKAELESIEREIGLPPKAPAPSVVQVNASTSQALLVAVIELIHQ
jgi:hypothetical protein